MTRGGIGVEDEDIRLIAEELSGLDLERFFAEAVHGTTRPGPGAPAEALRHPPQAERGSFGHADARCETGNEGNEVRLTTVYDGGPAQSAGLSAGDLLLAIDGLRVTPATLERLLCRRQAGDTVRVHAFRRDELMEFSVKLGAPASDRHKLLLKGKPVPCDGWLHGQAQATVQPGPCSPSAASSEKRLTMTDLAAFRKSYERAELSEDASHADPLKQFAQWLAKRSARKSPSRMR
jgi:predicted metalloprotease with PDZ domain